MNASDGSTACSKIKVRSYRPAVTTLLTAEQNLYLYIDISTHKDIDMPI